MKNIGSTLAILLSILLFAAGLSQFNASDAAGNLLTTAPIIFIAAICYRSAKVRRSGTPVRKTLRLGLEAVGICIILLLWLGRNDLKSEIAFDPIQALVIPLICLLAYAVISIRKPPQAA